jgi:hypothetical protein
MKQEERFLVIHRQSTNTKSKLSRLAEMADNYIDSQKQTINSLQSLRAIACYDEAVRLDVDNVAAIYFRSRSKLRKGDIRASLVDLDRAKILWVKLFNNDQEFVRFVQNDDTFDSIRDSRDFKKVLNR